MKTLTPAAADGRRRHVRLLAVCIVVSSGLLAASVAGGNDLPGFPVKGDLPGSESLLSDSPPCVLIGEMHGTNEIPPLVAVLARTLAKQRETVLCLEVAASEQPRLDRFLQSRGDEQAVADLLAGPHWVARDGRASTGYLAMLQLIRQLVADGRDVRVVAIDIDQDAELAARTAPFTMEEALELGRKRDKQMADNVLAVTKKQPQANLLVLVGNVHANTNEGAPWDEEYKPMGSHLKKTLPKLVSLNFQSSGGQAWVMSDKNVGPTDFPGVDRGPRPFIELGESGRKGYDGVLYVGRMTASPSAKRGATPADIWRRLQEGLPQTEKKGESK